MIRWCCYCHAFLGQTAPYENFSITHAICEKCIERYDQPIETTSLSQFYESVFRDVLSGNEVDPLELLDHAQALGVDSNDIFLGVLHPLLWKIGQAYHEGELSVAQEQLFSNTVNLILQQIPGPETPPRASILLFNALDNTHTIGIEFFRRLIWRRESMTSVLLADPPQTADALKAILQRHCPNVVGISIALPEHALYVAQVSAWLDTMGPVTRPHLAVGGPAVASMLEGPDWQWHDPRIAVSHPFDVIQGINLITELAQLPAG